MLAIGQAGELRISVEGRVERFKVGPGFAEVGPDSVTLLVDSCEEVVG
jgi:F0F1-type ATP synthase epsilon subunit